MVRTLGEKLLNNRLCHLLYNIDDSNENATQTSSLKTDNTRETVKGQPPPTQATHYFYFLFVNY